VNKKGLNIDQSIFDPFCLWNFSVSGINQTDEYPVMGYAKQNLLNKEKIMRKITKESSKAFVNFEPYKNDNTKVEWSYSVCHSRTWGFIRGERVAKFYLHGNLIAEISQTGHLCEDKDHKSGNLFQEIDYQTVKIDLCGWHTPTTRERINGVLDALGYDFRIAQRNEEQVLVRNADLDEELHMMETWKPKKHNEQIIKLSDDSFNPDIVQKVFDSKFFRTPRLDADGYLETGIDLNAITDF